jgi:hypothetical protein
MNINDALNASINLERMRKANETPKLEDFSDDHLSFAFSLFKKSREESCHHIAILRETGVSDEHPRLKFWIDEADIATLWMTQLLNAMRVIKLREQVASN